MLWMQLLNFGFARVVLQRGARIVDAMGRVGLYHHTDQHRLGNEMAYNAGAGPMPHPTPPLIAYNII